MPVLNSVMFRSSHYPKLDILKAKSLCGTYSTSKLAANVVGRNLRLLPSAPRRKSSGSKAEENEDEVPEASDESGP